MLKNFPAWFARHKFLFRIIAALVILYALAGFIITPLVVRHMLETRVSAALHRDVRTSGVRFNPFTFNLRLSGLTVADKGGGPFVRVGDLAVNGDPFFSLFKWGIVIRSIEVDNPLVRIIRNSDQQFNFSDLLTPERAAPSRQTVPESKPVRLIVGEFNLAAGEIRFVDKSRKMPFGTTVKGLAATMKGLDTRANAEAFRYTLSGVTEAEEHFDIRGQADIQPLAVKAVAALKHLAPAKYAPYYQSLIDARVVEGRIDIGAELRWSDQSHAITGLQMTLGDLVLKNLKDEKDLVHLADFKMEDAGIDFKSRQLRLGRISSDKARIELQRDADGKLNLQAAFAPRPSKKSAADAPSEDTQRAPQSPPWKIVMPALKLQDYTIDFEDLQPAIPVRTRLHHIALAAENLSTASNEQGKVDLQLHWADQGSLSVRGDVGLVPLQASLDVTAEKLDIRPLQSYVRDFVQLVFTKGEFSTHGHLQWSPKEDSLDLQFAGQASLDSFEAVDVEKADLFTKWKSLYLTGIHIGTAPLKARIEKVALTDFFNRLIINPDGTVNIETILARPKGAAGAKPTVESPAVEEKPASESSDSNAAISIKTITLQGGKVDYSDHYIKPQVHLVMEDLGGRISGLDNIKANKADVLLRGKVGGNTPLEIRGRINPLIKKPFIDLSLNFPGFDLSPFGPYAGKYLGYTLEKGQLAFSLAYRVADNKMAGQNKIQLSQLTFGDSVASPQATKLPIKLAVALLKDRAGNIDLDLPVKGDLNDPQFSFGGVILKMFVNLIVEIVSSPFKMLGTVFGGGEELAYLAFDSGRSTISPQQMEKLDTLEKILFERPGLSLEIQGQVAPQQDANGLRQLRFEEQLKAGKLKALVAAGRKAVPLDRIEITPQERNAMIQKAFDAADFPKPRDEKGHLKKLAPPEMEKLLYTAIEIGRDDLRRLAYDRASAAKAYLLAKGRIQSNRLFIVEPRVPDDNAGKAAKPQVQFNLK
jgi:Domain of Unknown Function (DUF748)